MENKIKVTCGVPAPPEPVGKDAPQKTKNDYHSAMHNWEAAVCEIVLDACAVRAAEPEYEASELVRFWGDYGSMFGVNSSGTIGAVDDVGNLWIHNIHWGHDEWRPVDAEPSFESEGGEELHPRLTVRRESGHIVAYGTNDDGTRYKQACDQQGNPLKQPDEGRTIALRGFDPPVTGLVRGWYRACVRKGLVACNYHLSVRDSNNVVRQVTENCKAGVSSSFSFEAENDSYFELVLQGDANLESVKFELDAVKQPADDILAAYGDVKRRAEVEKGMGDYIWVSYLKNLEDPTKCPHQNQWILVNATAAQKREAYLRTIGKWEESE